MGECFSYLSFFPIAISPTENFFRSVDSNKRPMRRPEPEDRGLRDKRRRGAGDTGETSQVEGSWVARGWTRWSMTTLEFSHRLYSIEKINFLQ